MVNYFSFPSIALAHAVRSWTPSFLHTSKPAAREKEAQHAVNKLAESLQAIHITCDEPKKMPTMPSSVICLIASFSDYNAVELEADMLLNQISAVLHKLCKVFSVTIAEDQEKEAFLYCQADVLRRTIHEWFAASRRLPPRAVLAPPVLPRELVVKQMPTDFSFLRNACKGETPQRVNILFWWICTQFPNGDIFDLCGLPEEAMSLALEKMRFKSLSLGRQASDKHMKQLVKESIPGAPGFSKLTSLDISDSELAAEGFRCLEKMTQLQTLKLAGIRLSRATRNGAIFEYTPVLDLTKFRNVRHLDLHSCYLCRDVFAQLSKMTSLRSLNLDCTHLPAGEESQAIHEAILSLSSLKELQELNLALWPLEDDDLAPLASLTELRTLNLSASHVLSNRKLSAGGLGHIANLPKLERLIFQRGFKPFDNSPSAFPRMENLRFLDMQMWSDNLYVDLPSYLKQLPALQELNLGDIIYKDKVAQVSRTFPRLTILLGGDGTLQNGVYTPVRPAIF